MGYSPPRVHRICGGYGDLVIVYPKPYSIYLTGTIGGKRLKMLNSGTRL